MSQSPNLHTISSSTPLSRSLETRSPPKMDPQKAATIAALLAKLAVIYPRQDFTSGQADVLIATYVEDLCGFAVVDIEDAIRTYRRNPKSKFFPAIGELIDLAQKAAKERGSSSADVRPCIPECGESRPAMWWLLSNEATAHCPTGLWQPHWKESEIPEREKERYFKWKAAKQARGEL